MACPPVSRQSQRNCPLSADQVIWTRPVSTDSPVFDGVGAEFMNGHGECESRIWPQSQDWPVGLKQSRLPRPMGLERRFDNLMQIGAIPGVASERCARSRARPAVP